MPRRERKIVLIGKQREDIDPKAVARVLIRLVRHWQREQVAADETTDDKASLGKEDP